MRVLLSLRLTAVVAFVMLMSVSCEQKKVIISGTPVSVNNCAAPTVTITKTGQVTWTGDGHLTSILFKDPSPFAPAYYTLLDKTPVSSGTMTSVVTDRLKNNESWPFSYTVAESTGCTLDPIVIITR
jgi:hypothetical protein